MSDGGRDLAKGAILTLAPTGLGFILSGWIIGVVCLFVAGGLSLILWTPLGQWLGFHSNPSGKSTEPSSNLKAQMAEFFREGDELRRECITVPEAPPDEKLRWAIVGGTPEEQCGREEKARDWDTRVSTLLWSDPDGKALGPGWKAAGEPPGKAPAYPKQSVMNPARLAEWYQGKLDYLVVALKGPLQNELSNADHRREVGQGAGQGNRVFGGAAVGEVVGQDHKRREKDATFIATEAEIALAYEEALEMIKLLRAEWPHITPDGALVQTALPDWRTKTTDFIGAILGSAQRAAFRGAATGANDLERLESEGRFLNNLGVGLTPDAIRVDEGEFLAARAARREHEAVAFLVYDNLRAPGAPPADQEPLGLRIDALMREGIDLVAELSASVEPEPTEGGGVKVSGGDAPKEWQDKADAFRQKAWNLLAERHPALLKVYEGACNAEIQKAREAENGASSTTKASRRRSGLEMAVDLANWHQGAPKWEVEVTLDGLSATRLRLDELSS